MEIQISFDVLRKNGLFVATPCYGGMCHGMYSKSLADLSAICTHHGIPLQIYKLFNESLIPRARNYCADEFMRSKATHLMFIDADIGFDPRDVIAMMALQAQDDKYDVIGGPYPKKCISWEKIKAAVDKGVADENPSVLEKYVGDFVFNPKAGVASIPISEPVEVLEIGTGYMMIHRRSFDKFSDSFPQYHYLPDHARTEHFDGSRTIVQFFQAEIDPKTRRYLSEDYWFCQKCQEIGLKVWLCPWMKTQHVGTYIFGGSLADLASINVAATVDPSKLKSVTKPKQVEKKGKRK
jgi:hypothetical protein